MCVDAVSEPFELRKNSALFREAGERLIRNREIREELVIRGVFMGFVARIAEGFGI